MLSEKTMDNVIGIILMAGTWLSVLLVAIGSAMYLSMYGHESWQQESLQAHIHPTTIKFIWQFALSFSSLGIIELGLLLLVGTQIIRVALLCFYYTATKDYTFTLISLFILIMLIYSSLWRR